MSNLQDVASPSDPATPASYLRRLWRGGEPLARLFFIDMLLWGSLLNLLATGASLALVGAGAPTAVAVAAFLAPLPYNVFLFLAVLRTAEHESGSLARLATLAAGVWAVLITLI